MDDKIRRMNAEVIYEKEAAQQAKESARHVEQHPQAKTV